MRRLIATVSAFVVCLLTAVNVYLSRFTIQSNFLAQDVLLSSFAEDNNNSLADVQERIRLVCGDKATTPASADSSFAAEWRLICNQGLVQAFEEAFQTQDDVHIVQIGAHIGFEENDPICQGLTTWMHALPYAKRHEALHWTFVEPSPPNFRRLQQNLQNRSDLCDLQAINAAVVADNDASSSRTSSSKTDQITTTMTFYSLDDSIDPATGYDSKSGQTLPYFITQVSGLTLKPILHHGRKFARRGLNISDYIVETQVTAKRYTDLMHDIIKQGKDHDDKNNLPRHAASSSSPPVLVLIDTEGFDCDIILNIATDSPYWATFLIYEHHQCGTPKKGKTEAFLQQQGYRTIDLGTQNTLAVRNTTHAEYNSITG